MGDFSGGMGSMWLFALLALAGVTLLVTLLVRLIGGGVRGKEADDKVTGKGGAEMNRAHQMLDERLANGELSVEEYRQRLQTLRDNE